MTVGGDILPNVVILDMSTPSVQYLCKKDKRLSKVVSMVGPISYVPHEEDAYSFLVHEIIEQMLSVKAGAKIYGRLENCAMERLHQIRLVPCLMSN
jgi:DNA-3-methyladenine glycosylase II